MSALDEFFADVPQHTRAILATLNPEGSIEPDNLDAYHRAVREMGEANKVGGALVAWATLLATTHGDGQQALQPHLHRIAEEHRDLIGRHGRALVNTARAAVSQPDEYDNLLGKRIVHILTVLTELEVWWLIGLLAAALRPVVDTVGGLDQLTAVSEVVTASVPDSNRWLTASVASVEASVAAGLSAIAAGHLNPAVTYLSLHDRHVVFVLLLAVADRVLRGRISAVIELDQHGAPVAFHDPDTPIIAILGDMLTAIRKGRLTALDTATQQFNGLSHSDQGRLIWCLAGSIGYRLAAGLTPTH